MSDPLMIALIVAGVVVAAQAVSLYASRQLIKAQRELIATQRGVIGKLEGQA